jgi:arylsulfatase A-like enzyme
VLRRFAAAFIIAGCISGFWLLRTSTPLRVEPRARPNVLLISIDTLRADRLGSYGYTAAATPTLDALAARGLRFTKASTVTPLTLPAHTSLLTGLFPTKHGVRDNGGFYVDAGLITVAERLREAGYRTGAFVASFVLDSRWGLDQGFDTYFDDFDLSGDGEAGMDDIQRRASDVV